MLRLLCRLWERWKAVARVIGNVQARVMLLIFYALLLSPFALGVKLFSDPLRLKGQQVPHWLPGGVEDLGAWESARRQS